MPKGLKGFQKGLIPWNKGKIDVYSEDVKKKMSFWLGKKMSLTTKKKMSKARKGRKATLETREKIRLAQKKWRNPNVKIICQICKNQFEVVYSRKNKAKFCSFKCRSLGQKGNIPAKYYGFKKLYKPSACKQECPANYRDAPKTWG